MLPQFLDRRSSCGQMTDAKLASVLRISTQVDRKKLSAIPFTSLSYMFPLIIALYHFFRL